jgi:hypothetical protein
MELSWLRGIDSCVRVICEQGIITSPARMLGGVHIETAWCETLPLPGSAVDYSLRTSRAVVGITGEIYQAAGLR